MARHLLITGNDPQNCRNDTENPAIVARCPQHFVRMARSEKSESDSQIDFKTLFWY